VRQFANRLEISKIRRGAADLKTVTGEFQDCSPDPDGDQFFDLQHFAVSGLPISIRRSELRGPPIDQSIRFIGRTRCRSHRNRIKSGGFRLKSRGLDGTRSKFRTRSTSSLHCDRRTHARHSRPPGAVSENAYGVLWVDRYGSSNSLARLLRNDFEFPIGLRSIRIAPKLR